MPMVNAPPGRLSTTTFWPSCLESSGARVRATLSVALPAACGTTSRIGRSGYWAAAAPAATSRAAASPLRLQLPTNLTALVARGVDVHVETAVLEGLHLCFVQLGAGRNGVGVAALGEGSGDRAVLALGRLVDVRPRAIDPGRGDAAAHCAVGVHPDGSAAAAGGADGRNFLGSAQLDADRAATGHPGGCLVLVGGAGYQQDRSQDRRRDDQQSFHGKSPL